MQKRTHLGLRAIGSQQRLGEVHKGTFAGLGRAMQEKEALFPRTASRVIAERALHEDNEARFAPGGWSLETRSIGAAGLRIVGEGQAPGEHISLAVGPERARA